MRVVAPHPTGRLRIAQVAPLAESVPPRLYGGTERVVSFLTEELLELDCDVTLFASGDSTTRARLIAPCARALRLGGSIDPIPHHLVMIEEVYRRAREFDMIHFHVDYLHYTATRRMRLPHLTTMHGRLDIPDLGPLYDEFSELPVVSISRSQRGPLPHARWVGNVYHGLPAELHHLGKGGDYLAFVGRVSAEKGLDHAIEIAERSGRALKVAAKVDRVDRDYFDEVIRPMMTRRHVEFLGEIDEAEKGELLRGAYALLFPIQWPEPFGMVMIEAMACGTPVIAYRRGAVPEVLDEDVTGWVVDTIDDAVRAVDRVKQLPRRDVRRRFEQRFSSARMAREYIEIYRQILTTDARDRSREPRLPHPGNELADG